MKNFVLLSIFLFELITLALSHVPRPCRTPDQWEGQYYSVDVLRKLRIIGTLSYDQVNKRERITQTITLHNKNQTYDILYLYNEKVLHVYDVNAKSCSKMNLEKPWVDFGAPQNGTFLGEHYYGAFELEDDGLLVNTWKDEFVDSRGNNVFHVSSWTSKSCVPILDSYVTDDYNLHCMFMDVTLGIKDETIFEPREECTRANITRD